MYLTIKCDDPFILNNLVSYSLRVEDMGRGSIFPLTRNTRMTVSELLGRHDPSRFLKEAKRLTSPNLRGTKNEMKELSSNTVIVL
jgi:hypothetical protein